MNSSGKVNFFCSSPVLSLITLSILAVNSMMLASAARAEAVELDAIVVTGEKIDKSIKDATTAVTVLAEPELVTGEVKQLKDAVTVAPNVIEDTFGHIAIRGVSGGGASTGGMALMTGARPRIATVVDGTPQDWSGYNFSPTNLWDVEQLEVLRGPQSTMQGSSAIGGALVLNTKNPTFEPEAALRMGLEQFKNGNLKYNVALMSSGAIVEDELAYRVAIDQTRGDGWLDYDTSGYTGDLPNLSESKNLNIRGKLLWEPESIPDLSVKLTANYRENDGEHANFASNTEEGIASQTLTVADSGGAVSRVQGSSEHSFAADVDYQFNSGLTNVFHISRIDSDIYADGYGSASGTTTHTYDIEQDTTAVENRLIFNDSDAKFTGVVGFFAARKNSVIDATQGVINVDTSYTTKTTALYGEGEYALTPSTKLVSGLRIENEKTDKIGAFFSSTEVEQNTDSTYYMPQLAIIHDATDATTLGASIRKGYSPSGTYINFSGDVFSFDSEKVTTVEFSSKTDFGEGTTLTANLFYNDYTDYQAASGFTIVNVDEAYTYGLELEGTTWISDTLTLRGSVGLLQSEIEQYDSSSSYEGNELSSAPSSNFSVGFTQLVGDSWSFGADATYTAEYFSDLANSDTSTAGDYLVLDARIQYVSGDIEVNGFIKNLTDEEVLYYREGSLAAVGQDRSVGISFTYRM